MPKHRSDLFLQVIETKLSEIDTYQKTIRDAMEDAKMQTISGEHAWDIILGWSKHISAVGEKLTIAAAQGQLHHQLKTEI